MFRCNSMLCCRVEFHQGGVLLRVGGRKVIINSKGSRMGVGDKTKVMQGKKVEGGIAI